MNQPKLTPGQKRLLENLSTRGMPRLDRVCNLVGCNTIEAHDLEDRGLVKIEDDESDNPDSYPVIFITETGKREVNQ